MQEDNKNTVQQYWNTLQIYWIFNKFLEFSGNRMSTLSFSSNPMNSGKNLHYKRTIIPHFQLMNPTHKSVMILTSSHDFGTKINTCQLSSLSLYNSIIVHSRRQAWKATKVLPNLHYNNTKAGYQIHQYTPSPTTCTTHNQSHTYYEADKMKNRVKHLPVWACESAFLYLLACFLTCSSSLRF